MNNLVLLETGMTGLDKLEIRIIFFGFITTVFYGFH